MTTKPVTGSMTADQLRVAIQRLSMRINRETVQTVCDQLEAELAELQQRLDAHEK
jgi:hypothetical protein